MSYLNSDSPEVNKQKDLIIRDQETIAKLKEINNLSKNLDEANEQINLHVRLIEESLNEKQENRYREIGNQWKSEKNNILDKLNELIK